MADLSQRGQIELLLRKIDDVPSTKQSVFWRATAPGHPHCELSSLAENRTDFRSTTDPSFRRYNWDLFDQLNSRWKKRLGGEPGGLGKDPTTGMRYFDIWPMSVQRPDAHLMPPNDCLHWCYGVGGVVEEWQKVGPRVPVDSIRFIRADTTRLSWCATAVLVAYHRIGSAEFGLSRRPTSISIMSSDSK